MGALGIFTAWIIVFLIIVLITLVVNVKIRLTFFKWLMFYLFIFSFSGTVFILVNVYQIIKVEGDLSFCMSESCFLYASDIFKTPISILKALSGVVIYIGGIIGLFISIKRFQQSVYANALTVYINYLRVFQDYINSETNKRSKISPKSINVLHWYNSMYPNARNGDIEISKSYLESITKLTKTIQRSNDEYSSLKSIPFDYKNHQSRVINALSDIGITLSRLPRAEFYSVEEELFKMIDDVNHQFSSNTSFKKLSSNRKYL